MVPGRGCGGNAAATLLAVVPCAPSTGGSGGPSVRVEIAGRCPPVAEGRTCLRYRLFGRFERLSRPCSRQHRAAPEGLSRRNPGRLIGGACCCSAPGRAYLKIDRSKCRRRLSHRRSNLEGVIVVGQLDARPPSIPAAAIRSACHRGTAAAEGARVHHRAPSDRGLLEAVPACWGHRGEIPTWPTWTGSPTRSAPRGPVWLPANGGDAALLTGHRTPRTHR